MSEKTTIGLLVVTGIILSAGQMLLSREVITVRIAIGRAIVSGGLGAAAGAFLAMFPDLPNTALVGIACVLVSLGTSSLERLLRRLTQGPVDAWYQEPQGGPYHTDPQKQPDPLDDMIEKHNREIREQGN